MKTIVLLVKTLLRDLERVMLKKCANPIYLFFAVPAMCWLSHRSDLYGHTLNKITSKIALGLLQVLCWSKTQHIASLHWRNGSHCNCSRTACAARCWASRILLCISSTVTSVSLLSASGRGWGRNLMPYWFQYGARNCKWRLWRISVSILPRTIPMLNFITEAHVSMGVCCPIGIRSSRRTCNVQSKLQCPVQSHHGNPTCCKSGNSKGFAP